jgi:adenosylhomocysteine nucleosidase
VKKIAIVSAMEIEISYVHEYLEKRINWIKINEETYVNHEKQLIIKAQVMGVGKVNAAYKTTEIIFEFRPDLIVNVGYAGAMAEGANKGDLAIGEDYVQVDFIPYFAENKTAINKSPREFIKQLETVAERLAFPYFTGKIATGDFFLQSTEKKKEIKKDYDPIAFDMESAAVAQVATRKAIDFIALRTFSDFADDDAEKVALAGITARSQIEHKPIILLIETIEQ